MAANNTLSTLRRTAPIVADCFKNAKLYKREVPASGDVPREMVVLFTWLGAKQKHAHKYAKCWTRRGHDVLYVTTSVRDLLFPKTGAEITANRVVDFLDKKESDVIVHGLSVGGYLTQRVLMAARDSQIKISHQIFDSFTNCSGMEAGVENAVNPKYQGLAKALVGVYVKYADLSSIYEAQRFAVTSPCKAPALYLHSLADEVTPFPDISDVVQAQQKASITTTYLIPAELRVPHVSLLKYLGDEKYMGYVDKFIENFRGYVTNPNLDHTRLAITDYITEVPAFYPERILVSQ
ncbi:transmembrane protein 53-like [Portunus trituberculatus]|uniref:transmembrane protein 53-like n=1 Tax=Portunus trituberculatus TaxID=210409 RepID=UPI001E1D007E|nr:transmembrane protein 53-like [Portunus trituberculatus]